MLILLMTSGIAQASIIVIANPSLHIKELTKEQLAALYLGQPTSLKKNITPYNQPDNTKVFYQFYQQILHWDASQLSGYWTSQVFSGLSQEPSSVSSDRQAIQQVEQDPTAIAYIDSRSLAGIDVSNQIDVVYGHYTPAPVHHVVSPGPKRLINSEQLYSSTVTNGYMAALSVDSAAAAGQGLPPHPQIDSRAQLAEQLTQINSDQNDHNIWQVIASHMTLSHQVDNKAVKYWIQWFQQHPKAFNTIINNAVPYLYYVYQQTQYRRMPAEFVLLPMIESGYNPRAYSSAGAAGLWQLMPATASGYHIAMNWWYDSRRDVLAATHAGLNFLLYLHRKVGTWPLAAAAYNAGPATVEAAIRQNRKAKKPTDFWHLRLPKQTEQYVPKLLAISEIIAHPKKYGVRLPFIPNRPFFASVTLTSQMDLQDIARFSGESISIIKALNPSLKRWATAPKSHFTLLLPVMSVATFEANLNQVVGQPHISWAPYKIGSTDSLASIAAKYYSTVGQLKQVNHLSASKLASGTTILVPVRHKQPYTHLANVAGMVSTMRNVQQQILADALKRAAESQKAALPAEVTGEPIKATDSLVFLLSKLYGKEAS